MAIAEHIATRKPGNDPVVSDSSGLNSGGIWDGLPTPDDMPEGIVFEMDVDHLR